MALPPGNISLFNISHSIEIRPGPVNNKLIDIAINNDSNSYPPTNPSDNFTRNMAPLSSTMIVENVIVLDYDSEYANLISNQITRRSFLNCDGAYRETKENEPNHGPCFF